MTFPEAEQTVDDFLLRAKLECLDEFEQALLKIARLSIFSRWRAKGIAQRALGIGLYWDIGWARHPWYVRLWRWLRSIA